MAQNPNLFNGRTAYERVPIDERPQTAQRLIRARRDAGLTQEQLARAIGRSQVTVAHIETGRFPVSERRLAEILAAIATVKAAR